MTERDRILSFKLMPLYASITMLKNYKGLNVQNHIEKHSFLKTFRDNGVKINANMSLFS